MPSPAWPRPGAHEQPSHPEPDGRHDRHFSERAFKPQVGFSPARRATFVCRLNTWFAGHLARACERWSYRPGRVHRVVCVGVGLASEIRTTFPAIAEAVVTIPNSVDHAAFAPTAA